MAATTRSTLKTFFQTGEYPTQGQFATFIDSFFNLTDDQLQVSDIEGLANTLAGKASSAAVANAIAIANQALAAVIRPNVVFNNQQVFIFEPSDFAGLSNPPNFVFWAVKDDLDTYVEGDKSTWLYSKIDYDYTFQLDAGGNIISYTVDLGIVITHGMYQIQ